MKSLMIGVLFTALSSAVPREVAAGQQPRWTVDLREEGYSVDSFSPPGSYAANRQIAFGSNAELAVASGTKTTSQGPNPVTGFVLDTASGRILSRATWTSKSFPYIFATAMGDYALNTADGLELRSDGLRTVKSRAASAVKLASPDGTSFAAWKSVPGPHGLTYFLDAETLQPTNVEYLDKSVDSICGDRIAYTPIVNGSQTVQVLGPAGVVSTHKTDCAEPRPRFLSIDVLAVTGCDRVDVIDMSHGRRFSHATKAYDTNLGGVSRNGHRFVVGEAVYGAGHEPKLRLERFTVIDVTTSTSVFAVEIKELRGKRRGASGAALTPDGSLLAINSQGVVRLFELPAADEAKD